MKKFLIQRAISAAIIASLVASIVWPASGFTNVAGLLVWSLITVCFLVVAVACDSVSDAEKGAGEDREKGLQFCRNWIKRLDSFSMPRRALGWAESIAMVLLAAYADRVAAAGFLILVFAMVKSVEHSARKAIAQVDAAASAPAGA